MDEIPSLGTLEDRQARVTKPRVDSSERQTLVGDARKKLYDEGYAVDGENVDGLLKGESLVPTEVWTGVMPHSIFLTCMVYLECFFVGPGQVWLGRFQDSRG